MIKWSDENIERELREVIQTLGIKRFPTYSEMREAKGNNGLASAVAKKKGYAYWSSRMGLSLKNSDTSFGNRYERIAKNDILKNTGLDSVVTSNNHPYDLLVNDLVKVDVKSARFYKSQKTSHYGSYEFNMSKKEPTCDIFIFYCIAKEGDVEKIIIIPSCFLSGQIHIGVGRNSRFDKFINNWSCLIEYNRFFESERNNCLQKLSL